MLGKEDEDRGKSLTVLYLEYCTACIGYVRDGLLILRICLETKNA